MQRGYFIDREQTVNYKPAAKYKIWIIWPWLPPPLCLPKVAALSADEGSCEANLGLKPRARKLCRKVTFPAFQWVWFGLFWAKVGQEHRTSVLADYPDHSNRSAQEMWESSSDTKGHDCQFQQLTQIVGYCIISGSQEVNSKAKMKW